MRRALEDGVIARERDPEGREGWSIADLARDLGCSHTRATRMIRVGAGVNLRAGQIGLLRPRMRAAVLAAIGGGASESRSTDGHVRRLMAGVGRISEKLDRALAGDGLVDARESADLAHATRGLIDEATAMVADLGGAR